MYICQSQSPNSSHPSFPPLVSICLFSVSMSLKTDFLTIQPHQQASDFHYLHSDDVKFRISISDLFFFFFNIYFWLCWVFVSVRGLSLVAASGGCSSLRCAGLSLSRPLLLRSTGSRLAGSVVVAHRPSCSAACGIFPDQGSNPCPLHWQADSQPLCHQGSPLSQIFILSSC